MKKLLFIFTVITIIFFITGCEKNIDIELQKAPPQLIVEAYINNENPAYNYVVLSKSQDYYEPNFQSLPVSNAVVTITEGSLQNNNIVWDVAGKTTLAEVNNNMLPSSVRSGVYFDPRLFVNPSQALQGKIGKYYLLEINTEGKTYTGVTNILQPVILDSIQYGFPFVDDEDDSTKVRLTTFYKDPDTLGNTQFYFWRNNANKNNFGWAGLNKSRAPGKDEVGNGQQLQITFPQGFLYNDTIDFYLTSVNRNTYNFWDSYNKARDNGGPFATPVKMLNFITGDNVIGCFSGFAISPKNVITKRP
jgi:hypothetical protein